jgi:hypothetical protein
VIGIYITLGKKKAKVEYKHTFKIDMFANCKFIEQTSEKSGKLGLEVMTILMCFIIYIN